MTRTTTDTTKRKRRVVALAASVAVSAALVGGPTGQALAGTSQTTVATAAQTERASCYSAARLGVPCDLPSVADDTAAFPGIECVSPKFLSLYFMVLASEGLI